MPDNAIYVGRPTKWGNPIKLVGDCIYIDAGYRRKLLSTWVFYNVGDIEDVIYLYEKLWDGTDFYNKDLQYWANYFKNLDLNELTGKDLACFCSLKQPCHADVLLRLVEERGQKIKSSSGHGDQHVS